MCTSLRTYVSFFFVSVGFSVFFSPSTSGANARAETSSGSLSVVLGVNMEVVTVDDDPIAVFICF